MALTTVLEVEWKILQLRRPTLRGTVFKRTYSFIKLNSDTSVTIATNIGTDGGNGKILGVTGNGNIVDKALSFSFVIATGVITMLNGATGATAGTIEVTFVETV